MPEKEKAEIVPQEEAPERENLPAIPNDHNEEVNEGSITPFEGDYMEVTVRVAKELAEYEKALDTILNFIIRRCYAGDFVSHDRASTPLEERTVNMIGAAAERIARDLGIQEMNRTKPVKVMDEKHPGHYTYECEGDFSFRGRQVHAIGRASTLNPFYSKAGGVMKKPEEIREEYIVRDAWRDCTKQGIKGLFGLRKIPLMKLKELGYDITKVKYVNFKEGEGSQSAKNPEATAKPTAINAAEEITVHITEIAFRSYGNKPITDVVDGEGVKYSWWGKGQDDKDVQAMVAAQKAGKMVTIHFKLKDGKYRNVESVEVQP